MARVSCRWHDECSNCPIMWGKRKNTARGHLGAFLDEGSEMEGNYKCTGTVMMDA